MVETANGPVVFFNNVFRVAHPQVVVRKLVIIIPLSGANQQLHGVEVLFDAGSLASLAHATVGANWASSN